MDDTLQKELASFKRAREALINAEQAEVEHHLIEFAREIDRNSLTKRIVSRLPEYDVNEWWKSQVARGRLSSLELPDSEDDRISVYLDLVKSMASLEDNQLSMYGFGYQFGKTKADSILSLVNSLVFRPLAELLSDRIRTEVDVANPAIRELAGVPLDQIPNDNECKIFLSHKTVDKPIVEPFYNVLSSLGFQPWLDSKDMKAGDVLHREITQGFDESCAVIFFVTPSFKDERWLEREIDQAINRKIVRADKFAIITLAFEEAKVPRPLRDYLFIQVTDPVDAMNEIIRALPIVLGPPRWRK